MIRTAHHHCPAKTGEVRANGAACSGRGARSAWSTGSVTRPATFRSSSPAGPRSTWYLVMSSPATLTAIRNTPQGRTQTRRNGAGSPVNLNRGRFSRSRRRTRRTVSVPSSRHTSQSSSASCEAVASGSSSQNSFTAAMVVTDRNSGTRPQATTASGTVAASQMATISPRRYCLTSRPSALTTRARSRARFSRTITRDSTANCRHPAVIIAPSSRRRRRRRLAVDRVHSAAESPHCGPIRHPLRPRPFRAAARPTSPARRTCG